MANDNPLDPPQVSEPTNFQLMLDEFCAGLSSRDGRVEMISAFHHSETQAGHLKDTDVAFAARYASFINQPA